MSLYLATDGYKDQLGGKNLACLGNKRFIKILKDTNNHPFDRQKEKLIREFHDFRGKNDIQDDLTVVGFGF